MSASPLSFTWQKFFLLLNCILIFIGNCGGPLIMRFYFVKGGKRIWLSSWLQTAGFPIMLLPLTFNYLRRRRSATADTHIFFTNRPVFVGSVAAGLIVGGSNYFYSYGVAQLPVSTSTLIIATQLAFTAVFAYFIVRQRFTAYSVNAVVLLTVGAALLGLRAGGDRPEGVTEKEYMLGFVLTVVASALAGLLLPVVELTYAKAKQVVTYTLVLEIQTVMCVVATGFATVGMVINNDFQAIPREAKEFELGETKYYLVLFWTALILQCLFLGLIGMIFYASSLVSAIVLTVSLPMTAILAVFVYQENFQAEKGVSLFLSLWGFVSYFFGDMKMQKKKERSSLEAENGDMEMQSTSLDHGRCDP